MTDSERVLVDTNVLLDIAGQDETWCDWSQEQIGYSHHHPGCRAIQDVFPERAAHLSMSRHRMASGERISPFSPLSFDPWQNCYLYLHITSFFKTNLSCNGFIL